MATDLLPAVSEAGSFYTELGIMAAFANPSDGETLLQTLEVVGQSNPVVKRMLKWIQPGAIGIDFGNLSALIAQAAKGGVDVILNDASNRLTATCVSIQGKQRFIGDSGAALQRTNIKNTISAMKKLDYSFKNTSQLGVLK
jgi:hypothetical protein